MKEKANYPNTNKNKNNKIYHFLAFRRKAKMICKVEDFGGST